MRGRGRPKLRSFRGEHHARNARLESVLSNFKLEGLSRWSIQRKHPNWGRIKWIKVSKTPQLKPSFKNRLLQSCVEDTQYISKSLDFDKSLRIRSLFAPKFVSAPNELISLWLKNPDLLNFEELPYEWPLEREGAQRGKPVWWGQGSGSRSKRQGENSSDLSCSWRSGNFAVTQWAIFIGSLEKQGAGNFDWHHLILDSTATLSDLTRRNFTLLAPWRSVLRDSRWRLGDPQRRKDSRYIWDRSGIEGDWNLNRPYLLVHYDFMWFAQSWKMSGLSSKKRGCFGAYSWTCIFLSDPVKRVR